jgi:hypothetical protein
VRTLCEHSQPHTTTTVPHCAKNWPARQPEPTPQNVPAIRQKPTATTGGEWQKHWQKTSVSNGHGNDKNGGEKLEKYGNTNPKNRKS